MRRALALDSASARAYLLQSELYLRALDEERRAQSLHRAVALDSLHARAQLALSRMLRQRNQLPAAYERLMYVLAFDATNLEVHATLGNGGALQSWGRYPPLPDAEVPTELARALDAADSLLLAREFDRAAAAFDDVLRNHQRLAAARLGLAAIAYYRDDFERAYAAYLDLTRDHPGLGIAHYGVRESMRRMRDARDPYNVRALARFRALPLPSEPERLRDVFTNYDQLDDDLKKIVLLSVAPLSNYIPILAIAGGTHYVLPFHHRIWQHDGTVRSRGRRTFDGRLWDDVKGQGGRNALSGAVRAREVMLDGYNLPPRAR